MKRIFIAGLLALTIPVLVSAATIQELQAHLQSLLSQLTSLQAQTAAVSATTNTRFCPNLYRILFRGMRGTDVTELQQFLVSQKYLASGNNTGFFGALTESGVKQFQCARMNICSGSPNTNGYGVVGPRTRAAIQEVCSSSAPPPPPAPIPVPPPSPSPITPPPTPTPVPPPAPAPIPNIGLPPHNPVQISPPAPSRILISPLLESNNTTAFNVTWGTLPKRFADIPKDASGNYNYYSGSVTAAPQGYKYGNGASAGTNAFVVLPPGADGDLIKVYFGSILNLSRGANWMLKLKTGLQSDAPVGTKATLRIGVAADKLNPTDEPWAYLATQEVVVGQTYTLSVPLNSWPLRDNFVLIFEGTKNGPNNYYQGIAVDDVYLEASRAMPWNSIARSNLIWEPAATQDKVINALSQIPSDWHRDGLRDSTPANVAATAMLFKRIQDQGKKLLINILPFSEDYGWDVSKAKYAGDAFKTKCGWKDGQFPLSTISLDLYEKRIAAHLKAMKTAGVNVEAFEIGNEIDWVCFNGDLPFDRVANQAEIDTTVRAYAAILASSVKVINQYYPSAMIVSAGMSVHPGNATTNPGSVSRPGQVIKALGSVDGKNYLQLIDRVGIHFYRNSDDLNIVTSDLIGFQQDAGLPAKPYWVTEWGYPANQFPTPQGRSRYAAFVNFLDAVTKPSAPVVDNVFFYALDDFGWGGLNLVDSNYNLLPETSKFFGKF